MAERKRKSATLKTAAPKRARKKVEEIEEITDENFETGFDDFDSEKPTSRKKIYLLGLIVIVLLALAYNFKSLFVAAMVNGKPVSRLSLISELEKRQGKDTLESIITERLIEEEAQKQNIKITQEDINKEISTLEEELKSKGQDLNQALTAQGMTRKDLEKQFRFRSIITKILEKDITVSDTEVNDYIKADKTSYPKGTATDEQKAQISEQLKQQKLSEKFQTWLDELRSKAKIQYFLQ